MADGTEKDKCVRFRVHVLKEIYETEEAFVRKIDFVVQVSQSSIILYANPCIVS